MNKPLFPALAMMCLASCSVNTDYDLSYINTDITILEGLQVPIRENSDTKVDGLFDFNVKDEDNGAEGVYSSENGTLFYSSATAETSEEVTTEEVRRGYTMQGSAVVDLTGLPEIIRNRNNTIILDNPMLKVTVNNPFNGETTVSMNIVTVNGSLSVQEITLPQFGEWDLYISPKGGFAKGGHSLDVPLDLQQIIYPVPDEVEVRDIWLKSEARVMTKSSESVNVTVKADIVTELNFAKGTVLIFEYDFDQVNLSSLDKLTDINADKIEITGTVVNAIPLTLSAELSFPDTPDSISAVLDKSVPWGNVESPTTTNLKAEITMKDGFTFSQISRITMQVTAKVESDTPVCLYGDQYIKLTIDSLGLPEGIDVKL